MTTNEEKKRRKPSRTYPFHLLQEALSIAQVIQDKNNGQPFRRILLADASNRKPMSTDFRDLLSSSLKYGLTLGTEKAENISLTELGRMIVKPRDPTEKTKAVIQATLKPELFRKIYERYNNGKLPQERFFKNVLNVDFGVDSENTDEVARIVTENGTFSGIVRDVSGSPYVLIEVGQDVREVGTSVEVKKEIVEPEGKAAAPAPEKSEEVRIFIAHSKNERILGQIKTMLDFGKYAYEVAEQTETTAIPVPQKIMEAMRRCNAGIINVSADEQEHLDNGRYGVNRNVLIEIGAAFVLYERRVVLVVDKRVDLPSNLQGLYKCEYEGNEFSWEAGLKLQKTITEFRASASSN